MVTVEPGDLCAWPKCTAQEMVSEEMYVVWRDAQTIHIFFQVLL